MPTDSDTGLSGGNDESPPPPQPTQPPEDWPHTELYKRVREVLYVLPAHFTSELRISGVLATDLFAFNSSLGATIEQQIVEALNDSRASWDPDQEYVKYQFVRQAQRFPDVVLRASVPDTEPEVIMGVELKGWYVLSKEEEPSFRYQATPAVCAPQDLLVVYPWALSDVISGSPELLQPYVIEARTAAEYRNWHWQYGMRRGSSERSIRLSDVDTYYPRKGDEIRDTAESDKGNNFGRFARTKLMDDYMAELRKETLSGIPISAWQKFLKIFSEGQTEDEIIRGLDELAGTEAPSGSRISETTAHEIKTRFLEIIELVRQDS